MSIADPTSPHDLETEIRRVLHARASSYPVDDARVAGVESLSGYAHRGSSRNLIATAVVAVLIVLGVVLIGRWLSTDSGSDGQPAGPSHTAPVPTTDAAPVAGATQVPLVAVDDPKGGVALLAPNGDVASYRAGDGPPITIADVIQPTGNLSQELSVESWFNGGNAINDNPKPARPGRSGATGDPAGGVLQVFHYPHWETPDDPIIFYAWTRVPVEAEYVLFETAGQLLWQRPLDGIAVFPVHDEPVDATLRAVGSDGSVLATEVITKIYNGAQYIPGQPQLRAASDPRYPLCRPLVGDDGRISIFDHGARVPVRITVEEFCDGTEGVVPGQLPYGQQELQAAGIALRRVFTDGAFVPTYVEIETTENSTLVTSVPVSTEDVHRRVAEAKERR